MTTKIADLQAARAKAVTAMLDAVDDVEKYTELENEVVKYDEQIDRAKKATALMGGLAKPIGGNEKDGDATKFKLLGDQLIAVKNHAMDIGYSDSRLIKAASGAGESSPSDGGFLVQQDFVTDLLMRIYDMGEITSRVRKIPISGKSNGIKIPGIDEQSRANGSRWGGVLAAWASEGDQLTGTKPKFRMIELDLEKLTGLCYATDELLDDAVALTSVITQAFTEEFTFRIEDAVIRGTGAGQPLGLLNSQARVSVSAEKGQATKTILYENVLNMWSRCWGRSRKNAVWLINQDVEPQLAKMAVVVGTGGLPVYLPPSGASSDGYATLFGRPVIPVEYCSTCGTEGDIILADFSQYIMADKGAMQAMQSMHVRFIYDEMTFRFIYRADGQPAWHTPLTPYQGSNTLSPYVTLASR